MKARKALLPATILTTLSLILYAPFLLGGRVLYWGVYLLQFYPWRKLAVEQIRAGHWPLWNPYLGAGTPLAANLQTAAFYPPNALFLMMPVEQAFGWELALHVTLAGLFAYHLGRTLGMRPFGALIAGLTYGGGGYVVAHWVFPSMVYAAAWLPLMLALTERLIRHTSFNSQSPGTKAGERIRYCILETALLALVTALQLLAGHAQTSYYSLVIVAVFSLVRVTQQAKRNKQQHRSQIRSVATGLGCLAVAIVWAIALAAIQLLPTAELTAQSQRAGNLTDLTFAYELSFWPWRIITLVAPDFFGNPARSEYWAYGTYWEEAAYAGILALMFAVSALATWWRRRREPSQDPLALVPFFALLSLLSLVLALGVHTPLYPLLFRYVPGFGLFQAPARLTIGFALGIAVLAGAGADTLRLTPRTRTVLRVAAVTGLGMALAGIAARLTMQTVRASFGNSTVRLGVTLTLASGVLLLRGKWLRGRRWEALVTILVAADLLAFGWGLAPGTDPGVYQDPVATAEFLQTQPPGRIFVAEPYAGETYDQYLSLSAFGPTDLVYLQDLRESLMPNLSTVHHLPGVDNYDPLTVGLYRDLYDILKGESDTRPVLEEIRPVLDLFGARYLVTSDEQNLPLLYDAGPRIYGNTTALPAAYIVHQARVIKEEQERLRALLDPAFDPHTEVILSHVPPVSQPPSAADTTEEELSVLREGPDRVSLEVSMTQPGYLVLADTYYPGWQATVDGEAAEILPANHAFRAVQLDKGVHLVIFHYAPLTVRLGAWITAGGGVLLALMLAFSWLRRTAAEDSDSSAGGS